MTRLTKIYEVIYWVAISLAMIEILLVPVFQDLVKERLLLFMVVGYLLCGTAFVSNALTGRLIARENAYSRNTAN